MQHIQTVTVPSGGSASITFMAVGDIPSDFTDLVLVTSLRSSTTQAHAKLQFNGSDANFSSRSLDGQGTSGVASAARSDNLNLIIMNLSNTTANTFSNQSTYIPNYRSSVAKSFSIDKVIENNDGFGLNIIQAGLFNSTAQIISLTIVPQSGTLVQHSSASLYGILAGSDGTTVVT